LCVADVMDSLATREASNLDLLRTATVASLIATLKKFGRNHLLVVQNATDQRPRRVRGVVSRTQIERQLGAAIDVTPIASSFSELERALS
jgi:hypothetical protein